MLNVFSRLKLNSSAVLIVAVVVVIGAIALRPEQGVIIGTLGTLVFTQLLKMMQDAQTAEQNATALKVIAEQAIGAAKATRDQQMVDAQKIHEIGVVTADTNNTGKLTLGYVNSAMGAVLLDRAVDRERLAKITGDPADLELAVTARSTYEKHMAQQAIANPSSARTVEALLPDNKPTTPTTTPAVSVEDLQSHAVAQIIEAAAPVIKNQVSDAVDDKLYPNTP